MNRSSWKLLLAGTVFIFLQALMKAYIVPVDLNVDAEETVAESSR